MTLHPPPLGRGISSWGVEGCARCQSLWLRKGRREGHGHGVCPPPSGHFTSRGGLGVSSRPVEERHPCRFISHPEGRRQGADRGIPFFFWEEEIYSTLALV